MADFGTVYLAGLSSGLDVNSIVDAIIKVKRELYIIPLQERQNQLEEKKSAIKQLNSMAVDVMTASQKLDHPNDFRLFKVSSVNITGTEDPTNILQASASSSATPANYDVQVIQTAQAWKITSATFASSDVTLDDLGIVTGDEILIDGSTNTNAKVLALDASWTIADLRDKINELGAGVSAYLQNVAGGVQLVLAANKTGESYDQFSMADVDSDALQRLGFTKTPRVTIPKHVVEYSTKATSLLFHMDEGTGTTVQDFSAYANDGTFATSPNDPAWSTAGDTPSGQGYSIVFDGNDEITVPNSASLQITDEITIEAWVKTPQVPDTTATRFIVGKPESYGIFWGSTGREGLNLCVVVGGTAHYVGLDSTDINFNDITSKWVYIAGTYNSSTGELRIYVRTEDELVSASNTAIVAGGGQIDVNTNDLGIGNLPGLSTYFPGQIDEVAIHSKELSSDEIQQHFLAKTAQFAYGDPTVVNSDLFSDDTVAVGNLLNLQTSPSGVIRIWWGTGATDYYDVSIDLSTQSLQDIANAINAAATGGEVQAQVVQEGNNYRLQITDTTGSGLRLEEVDATGNPVVNHLLEVLGLEIQKFANIVDEGQNAKIAIDGTQYSSPDNVFTSSETGISGLSITALKASEDTIRVTVSRNIAGIISKIQDFAEKYNTLKDFINQQEDYDEDTGSAGVLSGFWPMGSLQSSILSDVLSLVDIESTQYNMRVVTSPEFGIMVTDEGKLSVDTSELEDALRNRFEDVVNFFSMQDIYWSGQYDAETDVFDPSLSASQDITFTDTDGTSFTVTVNPGDTVATVRDNINAAAGTAGAGTRAYIVTDNEGKLRLKIIDVSNYTEKIEGSPTTFVEQKSDIDFRGIALKVKEGLPNFTSPSVGILSLSKQNVENTISSIEERISEIEGRLTREREFLLARWAWAEQLIAQYKATLQFIIMAQNIFIGTANVGISDLRT